MGRNRQTERIVKERRQTRAERRESDREAARERAAVAAEKGSGIARSTLISAGATVVVLIAVVAFALFRTMGSGTTPASAQALTNPDSLQPQSSLIPVGTQAPHFSLYDTAGQRFTTFVQIGHPILVEFYADWCPVCHAQAPTMTRLEKAYMPRGVRVWSVLANPYGPDYEDSGRTDLSLATRADLANYRKTYHVRGEQLIDPNFTVVNRWGASSYPTIYVIDAAGKISYASQGRVPYSRLSKALDRALKARPGGGM